MEQEDSCCSRKVSKYFNKLDESAVKNSEQLLKRFEYRGGKLKLIERFEDLRMKLKQNSWQPKVKVDVSQLPRLDDPPPPTKSADTELCASRKFSKNLKMEPEDSCCSRKVSKYFNKRPKLDEEFEYRGGTKSSLTAEENSGFRVPKRKLTLIERFEDCRMKLKQNSWQPKVKVDVSQLPRLDDPPPPTKSADTEDSCCSRKVSKYFNKRPKLDEDFEYRGGGTKSSPTGKNVSKVLRRKRVRVEDSPCSGMVSQPTDRLDEILLSLFDDPPPPPPQVENLKPNSCQPKVKLDVSQLDDPPSKMKAKKPNNRRKNPAGIKPLSEDEKRRDCYKRKTRDNKWVPPRSHLHLIQEDHIRDPWRVLVICFLLNRTTGTQAKKVVKDFFKLCPDAKSCLEVPREEIQEVIRSLGLYRKRSASIHRFSKEYLDWSWTHVTRLHGVGRYAILSVYVAVVFVLFTLIHGDGWAGPFSPQALRFGSGPKIRNRLRDKPK